MYQLVLVAMPYRRRRMGVRPRNVIQSFKKVLNFAPASIPIGTTGNILVTGDESVVAGQTTPTDSLVPTGSVVKFIEIQFSAQNLVSIPIFIHIAIEHLRSGQTGIPGNIVGGNPIRNQVHYQRMVSIGKDQNSNFVWKFKIPSKYQRVREGDRWQFNVTTDQVSTQAVQVLYKFYR